MTHGTRGKPQPILAKDIPAVPISADGSDDGVVRVIAGAADTCGHALVRRLVVLCAFILTDDTTCNCNPDRWNQPESGWFLEANQCPESRFTTEMVLTERAFWKFRQ